MANAQPPQTDPGEPNRLAPVRYHRDDAAASSSNRCWRHRSNGWQGSDSRSNRGTATIHNHRNNFRGASHIALLHQLDDMARSRRATVMLEITGQTDVVGPVKPEPTAERGSCPVGARCPLSATFSADHVSRSRDRPGAEKRHPPWLPPHCPGPASASFQANRSPAS